MQVPIVHKLLQLVHAMLARNISSNSSFSSRLLKLSKANVIYLLHKVVLTYTLQLPI